MTVLGFIDGAGRPRVLGRVTGPGSRLRKDVAFLVDTGADRSVLMPRDARNLELYRADDELHIIGAGFGGVAVGTREWVSIGVNDTTGQYRFVVHVDLPRGTIDLPSVLGRDILDRCRLTFDPMNEVVDLEVWRSDDFVPR